MPVNILSLPCELILEIIQMLHHPDDLENFCSSHNTFRESFDSYPTKVIHHLVTSLVPGCLKDALAVFGCPLAHQGDNRRSLKWRINEYIESRQRRILQWPQNLHDYRCFWELVFKVDLCIFDWVIKLFEDPQRQFFPDSWPGDLDRGYLQKTRSLPDPGLSDDERIRFRRAFFRYELYCRLCYQDPNRPLFGRQVRYRLFSDEMEPWHLEEIACVMNYVMYRYYSFMLYMQDRFLYKYEELRQEETVTANPQDSWADPVSENPPLHPRLAYLDVVRRDDMAAPSENMIYELVSKGLDWFADFHLLNLDEQGYRFLCCCSEFDSFRSGHYFYHEMKYWRTKWEPLGQLKKPDRSEELGPSALEASGWKGDTAVGDQQAWLLYNQFALDENPNAEDLEDDVALDIESLQLEPFTPLRIYAWAFWDTKTLKRIIPEDFHQDRLEWTILRLNSEFSRVVDIPTGRRLLQREWDMLLYDHGLRPPLFSLVRPGVSLLFQTMDRTWMPLRATT
ncbi:hypothetical protein F4810DRAFT_717299 [Camillea tinctor]|nr:hypothetical protein F4810DRAFT_717299 [Camillea tinctor]